MIVQCYDPGGTTGYARLWIHCEVATVLQAGHFKERELLATQIGELSIMGNPDKLVLYEKFQFVSTHVNPIALEVTGAIKSLCEYFGIEHIYQIPSQRVSILRRYPELKKHAPKGDHSVSHWWDAVLHGFTYAYLKHGVRTFEISCSPTY